MATVTVTIGLDAEQERVWRALTDPAELAAWFWPPRLAAEVTMEPTAGAAWRIASPVAGMAVGGTVLEADALGRIRFTWVWDGEQRAEPSEVVIDVGPELTLTHTGLADGEEVANHEQGWQDCLARLAEYVSPASGG